MRKKAIAALLGVALLLLLLPGAVVSADEKLTFLSINDTLPPELINCVASYGGQLYVPYYTFTNAAYGLAKYGVGISYTYFNSAATAYLSAGDNQLFFELNSGDTYDGDDTHYGSASAIVRNGTVYLPLSMMYRFFGGFSYSYISGNEYGSILRLTTDAVVLTDTEFLRAARNTMRTYYLAYNAEIESEPTPSPTPIQTAEPSPPPETHEGERVTLSFSGLPTERILSTLSQHRIATCFFLTAEDVRSDPDMVRRAVGEGHSLGVWCAEDFSAEYAEAAALLFEAARVRTILTAGPAEKAEEFRTAAEDEGMVWCDGNSAVAEGTPAYVYNVSAWLENAGGRPSLRLNCGTDSASNIGQILQYLNIQRYDVVSPRETN